MIAAIKTTTADKVNLPPVNIFDGMEEYSGWSSWDHLCWLSELSGLPLGDLLFYFNRGFHFFTDESVSVVWMLSNDYYKSKARLIYAESEDCDGKDSA